MDAPTSSRRRWLRFGVSHLFVLTLGIALGFAPLKLWELNTKGQPLIRFHVKAIEVPRVDLASLGLDPHHPAAGIPVVALGKSFYDQLQSLTEAGSAKVLAEPVLMTASGSESRFNVGGEIPVSVVSSLGAQTVEYREFGTNISLLPMLTRNGRIRVEFKSKISTAEQVKEGNLPSFHGTETKTELDLANDETVVVCANFCKTVSGEEPCMVILATAARDKSR